MKTSIRTLSELQAEKTKLKMQMEVSKRAFIHNFGTTKTQAKDLLLNKVAIPAGAIGIATVGISKLVGNSANNEQNMVVKKDNSFFLKMMPIILPLLRTVLSATGDKVQLPTFLENLIAPKRQKILDK